MPAPAAADGEVEGQVLVLVVGPDGRPRFFSKEFTQRSSRLDAQDPDAEDSAGGLAGVGLEGDGHLALALGQVFGKRVDLVKKLLGPASREPFGGQLLPSTRMSKVRLPRSEPQ